MISDHLILLVATHMLLVYIILYKMSIILSSGGESAREINSGRTEHTR